MLAGQRLGTGHQPGVPDLRPDRQRWCYLGLARAQRALTGERFLRAHYAELVSLRVGQDSPGLSAGLPDVGPARPECKKAINLLITVRGAAGEVEVHAVLNGLGIGDRHEADAHGRVLISPDDDLALALGQNLPAKRLRPEPGQAGQVVSVNDDVVESDRHPDSMRGTLDSIPPTRTLLTLPERPVSGHEGRAVAGGAAAAPALRGDRRLGGHRPGAWPPAARLSAGH